MVEWSSGLVIAVCDHEHSEPPGRRAAVLEVHELVLPDLPVGLTNQHDPFAKLAGGVEVATEEEVPGRPADHHARPLALQLEALRRDLGDMATNDALDLSCGGLALGGPVPDPEVRALVALAPLRQCEWP